MTEVEPVDIDEEPPPESDASPLPEDRFSDRELSWLAFNQRVLELAENPDLPLLARARFLAIFASNLDEFFMVRVAGLKRRIATGIAVRAATGVMPRQVIEGIWGRTRELMRRHAVAFHEEILPALAKEDIELLRWHELDDADRELMAKVFRERIFPVLTPLAVDPAHPFPYISGLSLNLAVVVRNPDDRPRALREGQGAAGTRALRQGPRLAVRPARGRHRGPPRRAVPRHGGAAAATASA